MKVHQTQQTTTLACRCHVRRVCVLCTLTFWSAGTVGCHKKWQSKLDKTLGAVRCSMLHVSWRQRRSSMHRRWRRQAWKRTGLRTSPPIRLPASNPLFNSGMIGNPYPRPDHRESVSETGSSPEVNHLYRVMSYPCRPCLVNVHFCVRDLSCSQTETTITSLGQPWHSDNTANSQWACCNFNSALSTSQIGVTVRKTTNP